MASLKLRVEDIDLTEIQYVVHSVEFMYSVAPRHWGMLTSYGRLSSEEWQRGSKGREDGPF